MNDLISVIVPIYKVEQYLSRCVDSLLRQKYENVEIVLVDDGSPDNCPQIADEYAKRYDNITVFHKPNGGLGDARNYGVSKAKGAWIAFVDSDDYVSETYISDMVGLLDSCGADLAITCVKRRTSDQVFYTERITAPAVYTGVDAVKKMYGDGTSFGWQAVGKLFRKELLLKYPFPGGYYEDCAVMYRIVLECDSVVVGGYINNYLYIERSDSILQQPLNEKHFRIFEICDEYYDFCQREKSELILSAVMLYQRAAHQMLACQSMSKAMYRTIFRKNLKMLRKNQFLVYKAQGISRKRKIAFFIQCTTPAVHRFFWTVNASRR